MSVKNSGQVCYQEYKARVDWNKSLGPASTLGKSWSPNSTAVNIEMDPACPICAPASSQPGHASLWLCCSSLVVCLSVRSSSFYQQTDRPDWWRILPQIPVV